MSLSQAGVCWYPPLCPPPSAFLLCGLLINGGGGARLSCCPVLEVKQLFVASGLFFIVSGPPSPPTIRTHPGICKWSIGGGKANILKLPSVSGSDKGPDPAPCRFAASTALLTPAPSPQVREAFNYELIPESGCFLTVKVFGIVVLFFFLLFFFSEIGSELQRPIPKQHVALKGIIMNREEPILYPGIVDTPGRGLPPGVKAGIFMKTPSKGN